MPTTSFVLVNSEFVPLYKGIESQLTTVEKDHPAAPMQPKDRRSGRPGRRVRKPAGRRQPALRLPGFRRKLGATTFYTTGTTGNPKGRVLQPTASWCCTPWPKPACWGSLDSIRLLGTNDVYMPITPMFHVHAWGIPYVATMLGIKQVYPGRYEPDMLCRLIKEEKVTFSHLRADHSADGAMARASRAGPRFRRPENDHRRQRAQSLAVRRGEGARHSAHGGLWHVGDLPADLLRPHQ